MRYRRNNTSSGPIRMHAKYAGKCACCGAPISVGQAVDYYPSRREIAHPGGLDGNSATCAANIRDQQRDPGFVDLDRMYEDQCADIVGR